MLIFLRRNEEESMTSPEDFEVGGRAADVPSYLSEPRIAGAAALSEAITEIDGPGGPGAALLSPEQYGYATEVAAAMAETLDIDRADIRLVVDEAPERGRRVVAIDGSPNGKHLGNYNRVVEQRSADESWYTIVVGGERVDTLGNTTEAAYRAMSADAASRGVPMPDSVALSHQNSEPWTATMLTGEPLTEDGKIVLASYSSGKVDTVGFRLDRGGRTIRVRPAVVVAEVQ
jgi:hypothetical protein